MEKKGFLQKIDALYTKVSNVIVGDSSQSTSKQKDSTPNTSQSLLGALKNKVLTLGTPKDNSLLYQEVIKREKQEAKEIKRLERDEAKRKREATKKAKEEAKIQKETTKKKISTKKSTGKSSTTKTKKTTAKTTAKKTTSTTPKTPTKTKVSTKKTTTAKSDKSKPTIKAKKTTTSTSSTKKPVTAKNSTTTKATTSTKSKPKKTTATKKPTTKATSSKKTIDKKVTETKKKTSTKTSTTKKVATVTKKQTSTKKSSTPAKGSKRDEKIALYIKDIKKYYGGVDEAFVAIIVKNLGPSIYKKDAELVSCSDPKELDTVRKNFLMKKLGINASQSVLDAAIQDVCEELKATRIKYRATFYYALAKKFKKESVLS